MFESDMLLQTAKSSVFFAAPFLGADELLADLICESPFPFGPQGGHSFKSLVFGDLFEIHLNNPQTNLYLVDFVQHFGLFPSYFPYLLVNMVGSRIDLDILLVGVKRGLDSLLNQPRIPVIVRNQLFLKMLHQ